MLQIPLEEVHIQKGNRTEYVYDARGSVIAEVNSRFLSSDVSTKAYSPFGEPLNDNVSGFGYNGEYCNAAKGMIYLRARFYAPEMNRFSQKDILRGSVTDALSLNRYLYCQNDPVNFIDPSGMATQTRGQIVRAAQTSASTAKSASNTAVRAASTSTSAAARNYAQQSKSAAQQAQYYSNLAKQSYNPTYAQRAASAANEAQRYSNLAQQAAKRVTDGGNSQREAQIYGGGSSTYTPTYTPTPSYAPAYQPAVVTQPAKAVCNEKGIMIGISVAEVAGGLALTAGLIAGAVAGGWIILGGALLGAGVASLAGGLVSENMGESFRSGWIGGEVGGAITGASLNIGAVLPETITGLSAFALREGAAAIGGTLGGTVGSAASQYTETQTIDWGSAIDAGVINGIVSTFAGVFGNVSSTILSDTSTGAIGKIVGSGVSIVNETVADTSSTVLASN